MSASNSYFFEVYIWACSDAEPRDVPVATLRIEVFAVMAAKATLRVVVKGVSSRMSECATVGIPAIVAHPTGELSTTTRGPRYKVAPEDPPRANPGFPTMQVLFHTTAPILYSDRSVGEWMEGEGNDDLVLSVARSGVVSSV